MRSLASAYLTALLLIGAAMPPPPIMLRLISRSNFEGHRSPAFEPMVRGRNRVAYPHCPEPEVVEEALSSGPDDDAELVNHEARFVPQGSRIISTVAPRDVARVSLACSALRLRC